jgi:hypothetical protein
MQKKYVVRLTDPERNELQGVIKKLKGTGQKVRRAQILLKADADGPNWTDQQIAAAFCCRTRTVEKIRQRLAGDNRCNARLDEWTGRLVLCATLFLGFARRRSSVARRAGGSTRSPAFLVRPPLGSAELNPATYIAIPALPLNPT